MALARPSRTAVVEDRAGAHLANLPAFAVLKRSQANTASELTFGPPNHHQKPSQNLCGVPSRLASDGRFSRLFARWRGAREFFLERLGRQDDEGLLPLLALSVELIDNNAPDLHERDVLRTPIGRAAVRLIERNGIEHGLKIPNARRVEISA